MGHWELVEYYCASHLGQLIQHPEHQAASVTDRVWLDIALKVRRDRK